MDEKAVLSLAQHHGATEAVGRAIADELRDDWSGMRELWIERMSDLSGWCCLVPTEIPRYLDPPTVGRMVRGRQRSCDPLDPETMRVQAWLDAAGAGGDYVVEEIATGEIVGRYMLPGSRKGAAPLN